jgi:hypothetical protein
LKEFEKKMNGEREVEKERRKRRGRDGRRASWSVIGGKRLTEKVA